MTDHCAAPTGAPAAATFDEFRHVATVARTAVERLLSAGSGDPDADIICPDETYRRLYDQAEVQYLGILRLLELPALPSAADPLIRSLIECATHVCWIAEGVGGVNGAQSNPTVRALCFETGAWRQLSAAAEGTLTQAANAALAHVDFTGGPDASPEVLRFLATLRTLPPVAEPVNRLAAFAARVHKQHRLTGCRCRGRKLDSVQPVLKAFMEQEPIAAGLYSATSATGHHLTSGAGELIPASLMARYVLDVFAGIAVRTVQADADAVASIAEARKRADAAPTAGAVEAGLTDLLSAISRIVGNTAAH